MKETKIMQAVGAMATITIDDVEAAFHKMEQGEVLRSVVVM
jgi:Zn-dependent alcohol dehydrogenase